MKTYVAYVFRAKRLTQTLYILFFCPYVPALAANLIEHHNILTSSPFLYGAFVKRNAIIVLDLVHHEGALERAKMGNGAKHV